MQFPESASAQGIEWIRQFGASGPDSARDVAVNGDAIYVVGTTATTGSFGSQAYIQKFGLDGTVVWTRQFGSNSQVEPNGVSADASGVYVIGFTAAALPENNTAGGRDVFLRKYDADGTEVWTRQFGTTGNDFSDEVIVVPSGIYLAGWVDGPLPGQTSAGELDAFLRKYDRNGNEVWTRQFGSSSGEHASGLAAGAAGIFVGGGTNGILPGTSGSLSPGVFLQRYDFDGNLIWSRQYGHFSAGAAGVALNSTGIYVGGSVFGTMPGQTNAGSNDGFVSKFDHDGTEIWTRQFGTSGADNVRAVTANDTGVYLGGDTQEPALATSGQDLFVRMYAPDGTHTWTTRFGTGMSLLNLGHGISASSSHVYFVGEVGGSLPGQISNGTRDAFLVTMISPLPVPVVSDGGVVNNASYLPSPAAVAPGSIAAVFGSNLNSGSTILSSGFGPDGKLATQLGGASVTVNGNPAPLFYSTPQQLGIQVPFELDGQTSATVHVTVGGQTSLGKSLYLDLVAPGIFTVSKDGKGLAAALHQDGVTTISPQHPARPGEIVSLFGTGFGPFIPSLATGTPSNGNLTVTPVTASIDGIPAEVLFSGVAPGYVGLNQINVRIPTNSRTGPEIPLFFSVARKQSNQVTIPIAQ